MCVHDMVEVALGLSPRSPPSLKQNPPPWAAGPVTVSAYVS